MSWFDYLIGAALVVAIVAFVRLAIDESDEWERFRIAHKCKVVSHIKGDVFNTIGFDAKGNVSVGLGSTSSKTGWACDDGRTYFR